MMRPGLAVVFGALLLIGSPIVASGQPPAAAEAYDGYAGLLSRYVRDGAVDYAHWRVDDPAGWRGFLAWLETADPSGWPVAARRAFWINAYNARVIAGVLKRYPIDSVRDVGFLGGRVRGFFGRREHPVAGELRSLDEIEKEILAADPLWDPAVHWGLSCASRSCPGLRSEPYVGERLDTQLDFQARTFLNGPSGHRLDRESRILYLSRIFKWYEEDFVRAAGSVREYAARYLTGAAREAALDEAWSLEYLEYDWRLNDARWPE